MAIAHGRKIISTIQEDVEAWGFLERQQAIRYKNILEDLPLKLLNHINELSEYKNFWKKELEYLKALQIDGFSVDQDKNNHIILKFDGFNDYGYCTTFNILKNNNNIGRIRIGFKNQTEEIRTVDKIPKQFKFLSEDFFSCIKDSELKTEISKKEIDALKYLLNDVRVKKDIAKKYINEDVLKISLFRDLEPEFEKLKEEIQRSV